MRPPTTLMMTPKMPYRFAGLLLLLLGGAFCRGAAFAQSGDGSGSATLRVSGQVSQPLSLTAEALGKFKKTELRAKDKEGREHRYTGVVVTDLLREAGVALGPALRGEHLAKYVLVEAADGYRAVFALPELDPEFAREAVLVAYQVDGRPLPAGEGPFRLVVPADKKQARWVRQATVIKVLLAGE
jgi:DMSO/TMAO reductase YedYZ molybdopterin-dependent catalytic subunit